MSLPTTAADQIALSRPAAEQRTFYGVRVDLMTRDELLGVVGYLLRKLGPYGESSEIGPANWNRTQE